MAVLALSGKMLDDGTPADDPADWPVRQRVQWARAEDGTVSIVVRKVDGTAFNLTGAALFLAIRKVGVVSGAALVMRQGTITAAADGAAAFTIVQADTINLAEGRTYRYDVQLVDAAGKRWQVVPDSEWFVAPIVAQPTDVPTAPAASTPLALGPSWLQSPIPGDLETDGATTEQWGAETVFNFDDATTTLANIFARLSAIAYVTGGTGTLRLRWGGTSGAADGTVLVASTSITATVGTLANWSATVVKPVGTQLVKLTGQCSVAGARLIVKSAHIAIRGAL